MSIQNTRKLSQLQIRVEDDLIDRFYAACQRQNVSMSSTIRELIEQHCTASESSQVNEAPMIQLPRFDSLRQIRRADRPRLTIAEMYCGPGGIALGAALSKITHQGKQYSYRHSWATDYDHDTCRTYSLNILKSQNDSRILCADIKTLNLGSLPSVVGFLYGFPCNDFSNVGETRGLEGKYGPLYRYGIEYIKQANPLFIFAENVSGLSGANSGTAFKQILNELANAGDHGYTLTTHLYKFEDYGIPQARHRYIIIGFRRDLGLKFQVPRPNFLMHTCKEAIENPPIPASAKNHELTKQSRVVIERLRHIGPGENAWNAKLPKHLRLNVQGAQLSQIYKRLDPKRPSYTVTGSGGGGTHVYHWSEPRALTNRERARLQTFPDDFEFVGSKESVRKQIGMAVPPAAAKVILTAILKTFAGGRYACVPPSHGFLND